MKKDSISPKTAAALDDLYKIYADAYHPPFYETPTTREAAAIQQVDTKEIRRRIVLLRKQGRVLVSSKGKVVPLRKWQGDPLHSDMVDSVAFAWETMRSVLQAAATHEQIGDGREFLDHRE